MSEPPVAMEHRPLRAPSLDGGVMIDPPLDQTARVLAANRACSARCNLSLQGRSLGELARTGRVELLRAACRYTRTYRDVADPLVDGLQGAAAPLLLAGHQPQLFHPGVWYKNFVLGRLARQHHGTAVNLLIDSDTLKSANVRVPTGDVGSPTVESVALDRPGSEVPYEQRAIQDRELWESFGRRAATLVRPLVPDPLLVDFWPRAVARSREESNLGRCLAQARHQLEAELGNETLELPQSHVCSLEAFGWFTAWLLANLPQVRGAYNAAVREYRHVNRVRSTAHPVPDLAARGEWLEAPLWIWERANPIRRRLFVRQAGRQLLLSDRQRLEVGLTLSPDADAAVAVGQLAELESRGIKLRTRALITTLFARLVLGDLFLHGIGGAKYDQVTDALMAALWGFEPPGYLTVTATLRLPIARSRVSPDALRQIDGALRELTYHPERSLDAAPADAEELIREKRRWVATEPTKTNARERCRAIRDINERLQPSVEPARQRLLAERIEAARSLAAEDVLAARDYAFCLYPEQSLRALLAS